MQENKQQDSQAQPLPLAFRRGGRGVRLPFLFLLIVAITIATATLVESLYGTDEARLLIYGSWWFSALWGIVVALGFWLLAKRRMWKRPSLLLLHVSFVVILAGALVTHLTSKNGFMHLRVKDASQTYWTKQPGETFYMGKQLPFMLCLKTFRVDYDKGTDTPSDYVSDVLLVTHKDKTEASISMNHIGRVGGYRIYQTSYDDDLQGSIFTINYDPWGTGITYVGYALLAIGMVWSSVKKKSKNLDEMGKKAFRWSTWLLTGVGILLASYMVIAIAMKPLVPVLRSPLLVVHVGVIMIAYVLLVVSIARRELLQVAVYFLSAGIFLGAIWANISWGTYWSWDPKEAWALITLIVYSLPLHQQSLPWFRSLTHYRLYSLFALATLLMTYFGVNFLLGGMHSYVN